MDNIENKENIEVNESDSSKSVDETQLYGLLKPLYYLGGGVWQCECQCENKTLTRVKTYNLIHGRIKSCGCTKGLPKNDLTNKTFGDWLVKGYAGKGKWICECQCENKTIKTLTTYQLTSGHSKSCGHNTGVLKDIKGQTFGELTVTDYAGNGFWNCECSCGKKVTCKGTDLRSGNTKSCGHTRSESHIIDMKGKTFGEWEVLDYDKDSYWKCRCSCGEVRSVLGYTLRKGSSLNCGGPIHKYKDISNIRYGSLVAKKYKGNGIWECLCDCGKTKDILGINLRNGSTTSCGCLTGELAQNKMLKNFGEIAPNKVNNPRTLEQIQTLRDKEKLLTLINRLKYLNNNENPDIYSLADLLGVTTATMRTYLKQYNLTNIVKMYLPNSQLEKEIAERFNCTNLHNRDVLKGKELDLLFEDKKVAVKVNGVYWHSTDIRSDMMYHQEKSLMALRNGINLVHVYEHEWLDERAKNKLINHIDRLLNSDSYKIIHNDEIEVVGISEDKAAAFNNTYNLDNHKRSDINIAIKNNNEIVGLMSIRKNEIGEDYQYTLQSLTWKDRVVVMNGADILMNYFINKFSPSNIIYNHNLDRSSLTEISGLGFYIDSVEAPKQLNNSRALELYNAGSIKYAWFNNSLESENKELNSDLDF